MVEFDDSNQCTIPPATSDATPVANAADANFDTGRRVHSLYQAKSQKHGLSFIKSAPELLGLDGMNHQKDHKRMTAMISMDRSSIAGRVSGANDSLEVKNLWSVAAIIVFTILAVHGISYSISEYVIFEGYQHDSEKVPDLSDNKFGMTDTVPTAKLNDSQFQLYMGFFMYATVMWTGLGAEYLVWRISLNSDWGEHKENIWRVAQFVFPLLVATSVGFATQGNFLCLPLLTASMWKLGFPETILFFYSALYEKDYCFTERLVTMIRGVGHVMHHSAATLYVTMFLFHVTQPTPDALSVLVPLMMQHWFVLLKYNYKWLYVVLATILEVWFEWTTFSVLENVYQQHWVWGIISLPFLFAHWCYFAAGGIGLIFLDKDTQDSEFHHKPTELENFNVGQEGSNERGDVRANVRG